MSAPVALLCAIVIAVAEVLPVSGGAHAVVIGLAFDQPPDAPLIAAAHAAAGLALLISARRRVRSIFGPTSQRDGRRAPSELPALAISLVVGLAGALGFRHLARSIEATPIAVGIGLLATGVMLASTSAAVRSDRESLTLHRGLLVGMAQALAALPGGSTLGAGVAALIWTGVRPRRALETAASLAGVHQLLLAVTAMNESGSEKRLLERPGLFVICLIAAIVAGVLAAGRLPKVAEKRLVAFGAYAAVLGVSLVAYGWALQ